MASSPSQLHNLSMRRKCLESGKATGLAAPLKRRVRCLVCGRLVRIMDNGEHLVVASHYVPQRLTRAYDLAHGKQRVYEGTF